MYLNKKLCSLQVFFLYEEQQYRWCSFVLSVCSYRVSWINTSYSSFSIIWVCLVVHRCYKKVYYSSNGEFMSWDNCLLNVWYFFFLPFWHFVLIIDLDMPTNLSYIYLKVPFWLFNCLNCFCFISDIASISEGVDGSFM